MSQISIDDHCSYPGYATYNVEFYSKTVLTTVTRDPTTVTNWLSNIESFHSSRLNRLVIGLDVEWRPNFSRHHMNPVATLQLCVGRRCLIFQIIHAKYTPASLVEFFMNEDYTFVGVGVHADLKKLENDYGFGGDANAVDLGKLAACVNDMPGLKNKGLGDLAKMVLGKAMEKPTAVRLSKWDNWKLTERQVMYAAVDAIASFEIGFHLDAFQYSFDN